MYPGNPILKLKSCPPFLAHALARKRNKRMPLAEIVSRSGLSERTYLRTARKDSWATVKFEVIERFLNGCNVNPWKMRDHYRFLKVHQFKIPYLTKKQQQIMDDICAQQLK